MAFYNNWNKPKSTWQCSLCGPPDEPGVYCIEVIDRQRKTKYAAYIGSSKNIRKRVMQTNHPYRHIYSANTEWHVSVCVKWKVCDNYRELEKMMIKRIKPVFNLQHAGKDYRSYSIKL